MKKESALCLQLNNSTSWKVRQQVKRHRKFHHASSAKTQKRKRSSNIRYSKPCHKFRSKDYRQLSVYTTVTRFGCASWVSWMSWIGFRVFKGEIEAIWSRLCPGSNRSGHKRLDRLVTYKVLAIRHSPSPDVSSHWIIGVKIVCTLSMDVYLLHNSVSGLFIVGRTRIWLEWQLENRILPVELNVSYASYSSPRLIMAITESNTCCEEILIEKFTESILYCLCPETFELTI